MKKIDGIDNLIFDLGMVLLHIEPELTTQAFSNIVGNKLSSFEDLIPQKTLYDLEEGKITPAVFRDELRKVINRSVTDPELDHAWNAIILDIPAVHIQLLEALKAHYKLFLLSNTNILHYHIYNARVQRAHGKNLDDYFAHAYYSHNMGCRKPDTPIYEMVIKEQQLKPENTLFIDDRQDNLEGAQSCGIKTHWIKPGTSVLDLFT